MSGLEVVVVMLVTAPLLVGAVVAGGAVTAVGRRLADPVVLLAAVAVTVAAGWTAGSVGDDTRWLF
jgi:hypothetical protein